VTAEPSEEVIPVNTEDEDVVLYDAADGVATITLNRPDRMNAWTYEMESRYFDLLEQADADADIRVIVVTGAGRAFCAGMDAGILAERAEARAGGPSDRSRPMHLPLSVRKPMIAAINGGCAGIGFLQALYCDVRFAASEAKLTTAFTRRGIAPEFGTSWLLARAVGTGHASDLLISGRTITGAEARTMGLVNRAMPLDELLDATYEYASDVAQNCSPRATARAKAQLWADWTRTYTESDEHAAELGRTPEHKEDFAEGIAAFVGRRVAHFEPLGPRDDNRG
jgi:enoyl-CoA hydratase/carnithine racemase